jgi:hypothetical protein
MSEETPPWIRLLAALALAGLSSCQSNSHGGPIEGDDGLLCAECSPRAGGETSDFGQASSVDCGVIAEQRAPTDEEQRSYELARIRSLLRDGLTAPLGWLSERSNVTSRTPESLVTLRFRASSEPLVRETRKCGNSMRIDAEVDVTTSDGSLRTTLTGGLLRFNDGGDWEGRFAADLTNVTGSVDLALRKAWSEVEGLGPREGELFLSLMFREASILGKIMASVGYPVWPGGIATEPPTYPRAVAPVAGHFPVTRCSLLQGVPVEGDQPLAEAGGRTPRMLLAEANSVLERCSKHWVAQYRDGRAAEVQLALAGPADLAFCTGNLGFGHWISWALTGSLTSSDGQLRSDITLARALTRAPLESVEVASAYLSAEPVAGWARCTLDPALPESGGSWEGYLQQPGKRSSHSCLSFPLTDTSCVLE